MNRCDFMRTFRHGEVSAYNGLTTGGGKLPNPYLVFDTCRLVVIHCFKRKLMRQKLLANEF